MRRLSTSHRTPFAHTAEVAARLRDDRGKALPITVKVRAGGKLKSVSIAIEDGWELLHLFANGEGHAAARFSLTPLQASRLGFALHAWGLERSGVLNMKRPPTKRRKASR